MAGVFPQHAPEELLEAMSTVFEALGRALICLDRDYQVVHASRGFDRLAGPDAHRHVVGLPVEDLLGTELFGRSGTLRNALQSGERREGWGATLRVGDEPPRFVSLTAAPVDPRPSSVCDSRVAFIIVLRSVEESEIDGSAPSLFCGMVARSPAMFRIFRLIQNLSESDATVLVEGESGTGKELVARAIHLQSPRRRGPLVTVNCGALPGELLESELFGHVRGAFTGAVKDRVGRFELASDGTLFLDEVGDLPLPLQVKLLRVLQEKRFERLGESEPRISHARIIAATNRDLRQAVTEGAFREDLYYRLRVVPIETPPLRERREDIEPLAIFLLRRVGERHGRVLRLSPDALRALLQYPWPGNVRELENALEFAVAVGRGETLHARDLPYELLFETPRREAPAEADPTPSTAAAADSERTRDEPADERERVLSALAEHHWRRSDAARALGISRTTLWRKMRELGLVT